MGAGRQYNEPCETFWAFIAPQGSPTQVRAVFLQVVGSAGVLGSRHAGIHIGALTTQPTYNCSLA